MPNREPSAAQAMYSHLPSGTRDVVQGRQPASVADAMFPSLVPKPKSEPSHYRQQNTDQSLAARCDANGLSAEVTTNRERRLSNATIGTRLRRRPGNE
jgi:hypothetical protein